MSLLRKLLEKEKARELQDQDFGPLRQIKDRWEGQSLSLWGVSGIQILIDAGDDGPSVEQREFFRTLREQRPDIRGRVEEAVSARAAETTTVRPMALRLSSLYIPRIQPHFTWRIWYDIQGEEHYWYGAEITDWDQIVPFTED